MPKPIFLPEKPDFTPERLPPEYLKAIGELVVAHSFLDMQIQAAIHGLARMDTEYGTAVTTHMTGPNRLSALESVAEITLDDMNKLLQLEDLITEARDSSSQRAGYVHAYWCRDADTNEVYAVREAARTGLEIKISKPRAADIVRAARTTSKLGLRVWEFVFELGVLPAIPGPRPRGHKVKRKRKEARKARK